jgi:hypothetical protein
VSLSTPAVDDRTARTLDPVFALFLLAVLLFLYAYLFAWPFVPIASGFDGPICLADAVRVARGEVMYRDFFQFITPGTALVFALMFKIFGFHLWIPNLVLMLLGAGTAGVGVVIAKRTTRPGLAFLPSAIFLQDIHMSILEPAHHWFSLLAAAVAVLVLIERRTSARVVAAGAFAGLAFCFTQARGLSVLVALGVFICWECRRRHEPGRTLLKKSVWLTAGFLAVVIGVNVFFAWKAGLCRFLWCTVLFGIKYYPQQAGDNTALSIIPRLARGNAVAGVMHWVFRYVVLLFLPIAFFIVYRRRLRPQPVELSERPMLLAIVSSFMLLGVALAPSPIRMASSSLPSLLLLGWFLDSRRKLARLVATLLTAGILLGIPYALIKARLAPTAMVRSTLGAFATTKVGEDQEFRWIVQHTCPADFFFAPGEPKVYFYLDLRNPSPLPYVSYTGYTTAQQITDVIRALEQHETRYIHWPEVDRVMAGRDPSDHAGPLRDYVRTHYHLVKVFAHGDEIWERKD